VGAVLRLFQHLRADRKASVKPRDRMQLDREV